MCRPVHQEYATAITRFSSVLKGNEPESSSQRGRTRSAEGSSNISVHFTESPSQSTTGKKCWSKIGRFKPNLGFLK